MVVVDDVPRHRADPEGPRSARRLGLHPAHLRRVHDGARDRVDPRGGERHRREAAAQRAPAAQPHHVRADGPGPRRALLPPARARLGRRGLGALGRPGEDVGARRVDQRLAALEHEVLRRRARPREGLRRARAARPVRQRVLGPRRLQAAARGEPHGRRALPRGARLAAGVHPPARGAGRQEPAPPELPRGRHGDAGRSGQAGVDQRGHHRAAEGAHREGPRLRRARLHPGRARRGLLLQGLGGLRRRRRQLPRLRRVPRRRRADAAAVPAVGRHLEQEPREGRARSSRRRSASTSRTPGTSTRRATTRGCTRPSARPARSTRARSRRSSAWTRARSTAGSSRPATTTTRWRWGPSRACSWPTGAGSRA